MNRHSLGWAVQKEHGELLHQKVAPYILGVAFFVAVLVVGSVVWSLQERKDCLQWKFYEQNQPNFRVSEDMNKQCYNYGINFKP